MTALPSLFISHGAPNIVLYDSPTRNFLRGLGARFPRPKAILIMSAHFEAAEPTFEAGANPPMMYDFGGFERELYGMTYPAPGAPEVAAQAAALAEKAGLKPQICNGRGFDHGTWIPLLLMYRLADIPVATISVQPAKDGAHHIALGRALAPLREEGVLIVGSGGATHNLRAFFSDDMAKTPDWVENFNEWLFLRADQGDEKGIANWLEGPDALRNHPTPEHFQPFPFAFGAGGPGAMGRRLHHAYLGPISLDAYAFE
jgi:4,5-DOPA dioxygenase extradiol